MLVSFTHKVSNLLFGTTKIDLVRKVKLNAKWWNAKSIKPKKNIFWFIMINNVTGFQENRLTCSEMPTKKNQNPGDRQFYLFDPKNFADSTTNMHQISKHFPQKSQKSAKISVKSVLQVLSFVSGRFGDLFGRPRDSVCNQTTPR
jgi:hypothetical protein